MRYLREYPYEWRERQQQYASNLDRVALLGRFIAPQGIGAELGVHKGYVSPILFPHLAPRKLCLIDPWYLQGRSWCWGDGNRNAIDALRRILREMEEDLVSGKVDRENYRVLHADTKSMQWAIRSKQ